MYRAPEERWDPAADRVRLDVFSLGALAYFVISGRPPASDQADLRSRLAREGGLDLAGDAPDAPYAVRRLVLEATRGVVSERLPDVAAFLHRLDDAERAADPEPADDDDPLEAVKGRLLAGRFEMLGRLGTGSTAAGLLVADHRADGEKRVLKVALDDAAARRLESEAEVLAPLRHPRLVRLIEGPLWIGGRTALLLEQAGDQTLADVLRERPRLSLDLLERWGVDLLEAVVELDRAGVDHRDLKPANLGVREQRGNRTKHLVLFDFSLARAGASAVDAGTPPYLDPFIGTSERPRWDSAAERYAAAVTLYEMATGRMPVYGDGRTPPDVTRAEARVEPGAFDPSVAGALSAFFRRALRQDFRERHGTAADMLAEWRAVFTAPIATVPDDADSRAAAATLTTPLAESGLSAQGAVRVGTVLGGDRRRSGPARPWPALRDLGCRRAEPQGGPDQGEAVAGTTWSAGGRRRSWRRSLSTTRWWTWTRSAQSWSRRPAASGRPSGDRSSGCCWAWTASWTLPLRSRSWRAPLVSAVPASPRRCRTASSHGPTRRGPAGCSTASPPAPPLLCGRLAGWHCPPRWPTTWRRTARRRSGGVGCWACSGSPWTGPIWWSGAAATRRRSLDAGGAPVAGRRARSCWLRTRARWRLRTRWAAQPTGCLPPPRPPASGSFPRLASRRSCGRSGRRTPGRWTSSGWPGSRPGCRNAPQPPVGASCTPATCRRPMRSPWLSARSRPRSDSVPTRSPRASEPVSPTWRRCRCGRSLDAIVTAAGLPVRWDPDADAYVTSSRGGSMTALASRLTASSVTRGDPRLRGTTDARLAESVGSRSFLALGAAPGLLDEVAAALVARHGAVTVDVTAVLLDAVRAQADRASVPWDEVRAADAAEPGSRPAQGLAALVRAALPAVRDRITVALDAAPEGSRPVLLTEAAPLARYGHVDLLAAYADLTAHRRQAVWLLLPVGVDGGPLLDRAPVPLAHGGQFVRLPDDWTREDRHAASPALEGEPA